MVVSRLQRQLIPTNVVGGDAETPHTMLDFNNMHQIVSTRVPTARISSFLVVLISFIVCLMVFATCVMCTSCIRRKLKTRDTNALFCRSETSETLIESTLINSENPTMYSAIDV